jgi:hypothetical protein
LEKCLQNTLKMQWKLMDILLTSLALYKDCHESSHKRNWNFATVW